MAPTRSAGQCAGAAELEVDMSQILKFPVSVRRPSNDGSLEKAASRKKDRRVTKMRSRHVPVMTGDQWREFIRPLTPDDL